MKDNEQKKWLKEGKEQCEEEWTRLHDKDEPDRKIYLNERSGELFEMKPLSRKH